MILTSGYNPLPNNLGKTVIHKFFFFFKILFSRVKSSQISRD